MKISIGAILTACFLLAGSDFASGQENSNYHTLISVQSEPRMYSQDFRFAAAPYRTDRGIEGLHLYRIKPGHIIYRWGLRSGDVLKSVNGVAMNSVESIFKISERIESSRSGTSLLRLEVLRGRRIVIVDVILEKDPVAVPLGKRLVIFEKIQVYGLVESK